MTAMHMITPVGKLPIREGIRMVLSKMTDREVADAALRSGPFIDPESYAELCHRGLSGAGIYESDTYELIEKREKEAEGE